MDKLDTVMNDLELCTHPTPSACRKCTHKGIPDDCPYCFMRLAADALELLKEQPKIVRCKDCKWSWCLNPNDESPFYVCRHPTLCNMRMSHEGNWYCGNGELKDGEQE